jgi:hypothetical protein
MMHGQKYIKLWQMGVNAIQFMTFFFPDLVNEKTEKQ